jgi:hypothetical protein
LLRCLSCLGPSFTASSDVGARLTDT